MAILVGVDAVGTLGVVDVVLKVMKMLMFVVWRNAGLFLLGLYLEMLLFVQLFAPPPF